MTPSAHLESARILIQRHSRGHSVLFDIRLGDSSAGAGGRLRRRLPLADLVALLRAVPGEDDHHPVPAAVLSAVDIPTMVADAAARWMREVVTIPGTYKPDEVYRKQMHWRAHVEPVFGALPLRAVTPSVVSRWIGDMTDTDEPPAPSTIRNRVAVLSALMTWCVAMGWLATNPVSMVKLPKIRRSGDHIHIFTPEEITRLITHFRAAGDPWDTMIPVLLLTGVRRGELVALRQEDIDVSASTLNVCRAISGTVVGVPKGGRSRLVPLSDVALAVVRLQMKRLSTKRGPLWPSPVVGREYRGVDDVGAAVADGLRTLGIPATMHDFRHTCATFLAAGGTAPQVIQRVLGHENIQTTMRYVHAVRADADLVAAMARLTDALRDSLSLLSGPAP